MLQSIIIFQLTNAYLFRYISHREKKHNKTYLKHLIIIQYQANNMIYKIISALVLDIEVYTIFIKQNLYWLINNTFYYIVSSLIYAKIFDF